MSTILHTNNCTICKKPDTKNMIALDAYNLAASNVEDKDYPYFNELSKVILRDKDTNWALEWARYIGTNRDDMLQYLMDKYESTLLTKWIEYIQTDMDTIARFIIDESPFPISLVKLYQLTGLYYDDIVQQLSTRESYNDISILTWLRDIKYEEVLTDNMVRHYTENSTFLEYNGRPQHTQIFLQDLMALIWKNNTNSPNIAKIARIVHNSIIDNEYFIHGVQAFNNRNKDNADYTPFTAYDFYKHLPINVQIGILI